MPVSSTLRDLVIGSGLEFDDRVAHELKGVPGAWRLLRSLLRNFGFAAVTYKCGLTGADVASEVRGQGSCIRAAVQSGNEPTFRVSGGVGTYIGVFVLVRLGRNPVTGRAGLLEPPGWPHFGPIGLGLGLDSQVLTAVRATHARLGWRGCDRAVPFGQGRTHR